MPAPLLFDTDVLIDCLRGQADALAYLRGVKGPLLVSAATVAELYAGVRDGTERVALQAFLAAFQVLPIDEGTARQGGLFRRDYGKSHSVGLVDALIAATALAAGAVLVTLNRKHFPMLTSVTVPYTKP